MKGEPIFQPKVAAFDFQDEQSDQTENNLGNDQSSCRPASDERLPMCRECGRTFLKFKALYGHLRLHPNRGYKGAYPPPGYQKKRRRQSDGGESALPAKKWSAKAKTGGGRNVYTVQRTDVVAVAAEILILMTEGKHGYDHDQEDEAAADVESEVEIDQGTERMKTIERKKMPHLHPVRGGGKYRCDQCNKTFPSHQALGGHRASHNKYKTKADQDQSIKIMEESVNAAGGGAEEKAIPYSAVSSTVVELRAGAAAAAAAGHQCRICGEIFASGQALGGHKRRHYNAKINSAEISPAVSTQISQ